MASLSQPGSVKMPLAGVLIVGLLNWPCRGTTWKKLESAFHAVGYAGQPDSESSESPWHCHSVTGPEPDRTGEPRIGPEGYCFKTIGV